KALAIRAIEKVNTEIDGWPPVVKFKGYLNGLPTQRLAALLAHLQKALQAVMGLAGDTAEVSACLGNGGERHALDRLGQSSAPRTKDTKAKTRVKRGEANAAMMAAVEEVPERMQWSAREWATHIGCSTATVWHTEMWRQGRRAREKAKQERMPRNRGTR